MNSGLQPYATKSMSQNSMSDVQRPSVCRVTPLPVNQTDGGHALGRVNEGRFTVNDDLLWGYSYGPTNLSFHEEAIFVAGVSAGICKTRSVHHKVCLPGQNVTY